MDAISIYIFDKQGFLIMNMTILRQLLYFMLKFQMIQKVSAHLKFYLGILKIKPNFIHLYSSNPGSVDNNYCAVNT